MYTAVVEDMQRANALMRTLHAEPVHAEPVHAEPVHAEPVHAEPVHAEAVLYDTPETSGGAPTVSRTKYAGLRVVATPFHAVLTPTNASSMESISPMGQIDSNLECFLSHFGIAGMVKTSKTGKVINVHPKFNKKSGITHYEARFCKRTANNRNSEDHVQVSLGTWESLACAIFAITITNELFLSSEERHSNIKKMMDGIIKDTGSDDWGGKSAPPFTYKQDGTTRLAPCTLHPAPRHKAALLAHVVLHQVR